MKIINNNDVCMLPLQNGKHVISIEEDSFGEQWFITASDILIEGNNHVISCGRYAFEDMPEGGKRGTFRSFTMFVDGVNVEIRNLTIENSSGDSVTHGQAIALYADADKLVVDNCNLIGAQDTLFTGPLPLKEMQPGGFRGPKEFAERRINTQLFRNCYICGDVDFIFGSADAVFENCIVESKFREKEKEIQGYVTAPSTYEGHTGYIFRHCDFISNDCPEASVYLGRPWRDYARAEFIGCSFGSHIHPDHFHDWNKPWTKDTTCFKITE